MSDDQQAAFGAPPWLPDRVRQAMARDEIAEAAEAARAAREEADKADRAREAALNSYREAAAARGEIVSVMSLARGEVGGRSVAAILGDAEAIASRDDAVAEARQRREEGSVHYLDVPEPQVSRSSDWPGSEYELDRQLRQAEDLHSDLVRAKSRADFAAAAEAARAKAAHGTDVRRDGPASYLTAYSEITRVAGPHGMAQLGDDDGNVVR